MVGGLSLDGWMVIEDFYYLFFFFSKSILCFYLEKKTFFSPSHFQGKKSYKIMQFLWIQILKETFDFKTAIARKDSINF